MKIARCGYITNSSLSNDAFKYALSTLNHIDPLFSRAVGVHCIFMIEAMEADFVSQ